VAKVEDDLVYELFDDIKFELLIKWADVLGVNHNEDEWAHDEWPDLESELRQEVSNTMIGILTKEE